MLLEEQDNLRNGQQLTENASELKQQLNSMRAECVKLQKANTKMKNDMMTHAQEPNKQTDLLMRQGVSIPRIDRTGGRDRNIERGVAHIKKHTEYLVEKQDAQLYKMLHEVFRALHRNIDTDNLRWHAGDVQETIQGMDYMSCVRGRNDDTNPSNLTKVGIIPAPLEEWHASKGNILPSWRSLFLFRKRIKEKLLSLQTRDKLILGDIYSRSRFAKKSKSKMRLNVY